MGSIIATDVALGFGPVVLAEGINLTVSTGRVIGLVGANGAGKTTLLRVLAGLTEPQAGNVARAPSSTTVGYLAQQLDVISPNETIAAWLARRTGVGAAAAAMEAAADALGRGDAMGQDYGDHLDRWLALGGADLPSKLS